MLNSYFSSFKSAKISCNGNYVDIDASNYQCSSDVDAMDEVRGSKYYLDLFHHQILICTEDWWTLEFAADK